MTPDTLNFSGDTVTYLGFVGVVSAGIIIATAFRRFFNSPYNVRYVKPNDTPSDSSGSNSADCT